MFWIFEDLSRMSMDNMFWVTLLRLSVAMLCGGVIGVERGRKRRPAGFRTHMLVCIGAALAMLISQYLTMIVEINWSSLVSFEGQKYTDASRLGAQVINGIGFLGAGTIIVTGQQEVKGMTTAAGHHVIDLSVREDAWEVLMPYHIGHSGHFGQTVRIDEFQSQRRFIAFVRS